MLHQWISGDQFEGALMQGQPTIDWERTPLGVRYLMVRHAECIVPNIFTIPSIREAGTAPKRKERGTELSWAVPVDNEHVRGISSVAWPLENGGPKPDWKPATDTIADIRPGSFLKRSYEERQRPDDLQAQEGQRPIAVGDWRSVARSVWAGHQLLVASDERRAAARNALKRLSAALSRSTREAATGAARPLISIRPRSS